MKKTVFAAFVLVGLFLVSGGVVKAQTSDAKAEYDKYVALMRQDLRSGKKQFMALNMTLTDTEATKFWPVYDQYTAEQAKLFDSRIKLIEEYGANFEKLTDATAASLNQRSITLDKSFTSLRLKYIPLVAKVLPGKKSALFFQLDKRIGLLIDLQIAAQIPLVVQ
ncbi:MAG TPA: hypothetical protein PLL77_10280 [Pyrinomonadaceae bacterium]|nr:hypothetical protein [Pyrinomonadaceae bacterium]